MADSVSGLTDLMDDFDLGDATNTGYERCRCGNYRWFLPSKCGCPVRLFADFWMKLYSNCCLQRNYAVEFLH